MILLLPVPGRAQDAEESPAPPQQEKMPVVAHRPLTAVEEALFAAAEKGDLDAARQALADGARPDALNDNSATALMKAAYYGRADLAAVLIAAGASVHRRNAQGQTPLIIAVLSAPYDGELPADLLPDAVNRQIENETTLEAILATQQRLYQAQHKWQEEADSQKEAQKTETVRLLLANGTNPRLVAADGMTALHKAAVLNRGAITRLLLQAGASPYARDAEGQTPLFLAASRGAINSVRELLIPSGRDGNAAAVNALSPGFDSNEETPLMRAVMSRNVEMARIMIARGANVNFHSRSGNTPLIYACNDVFGDLDAAMANFLLDSGADAKFRSAKQGNALCALLKPSPFDPFPDDDVLGFDESREISFSVAARQKMQEEQKRRHEEIRAARQALTKRLVEAGAEVNIKNENGMTPLMGAAAWGDPIIVGYLLEKGASPVAQDAYDAGVLHYAAPRPDVIALLLRAGADPNLWAESGTPLMRMASSGRPNKEAFRLLLDAGAKINAHAKDGPTVLHRITLVPLPSPEVISLLLERGADPYAEFEQEGSKERLTPLMQAIRYNRVETVRLFVKAGVDPQRKNSQGVSALNFARQHQDETRRAQAESKQIDEIVRLLTAGR